MAENQRAEAPKASTTESSSHFTKSGTEAWRRTRESGQRTCDRDQLKVWKAGVVKSAGVFLGWSHLVWIHILALPLAGYISLSKLLNHSVLCFFFFVFVCLFLI